VLVIGRVVDARRQDHHVRLVHDRRRDGQQHLQQVLRILLDGPDVVRVEDLGPGPLQDPAVLDQVGDAGRCSEVVFEHEEGARSVPDQVTPDDVGVDAQWDVHPPKLRR
jgi:hypothetical protein